MTRTYAEMFYLFFRFYEKRSDLNPLLSAGVLLVAVQLICAVDVFLILSWFGLSIKVFSNEKMAIANAGAILSFLNFFILRGGRAEGSIALVRESSLGRARWVLAVITCATVFTILLYKGLLVGS